MRAYKHKPKPCPNGNRHQRELRLEMIARESHRCQIFTEQESLNKLKAEATAEGR